MHTASIDVISLFCRLNMNVKKDLPIRPSEMGLLILVATSQRPISPVDAAAYFNISKPMVTVMVRALTKEGYVQKQQSEHDKRSYFLLPTPKGRALAEETFDEYNLSVNALEKGLATDEFEALMGLLDKANHILMEEKNNG